MRDLKIIVPQDRTKEAWNMDIDVIQGFPVFVDNVRNTQDQRAALAAYMVKGTVPGKADIGIDWSLLYNQNATVLDIDNAIKQNIQKNAGTPSTANQSYLPLYTKDEKGIHVVIYQS